MLFTPLSENEIAEAGLLPDGIYSYQVFDAEEKVSKAGNDYISLTLKVRDEVSGRQQLVFTNLSLIKLLKHFCDVNGMEQEYRAGRIMAQDILDKSGGRVQIGREGEKPDGKGGFYKAKNIVKDYVSDAEPSRLMPLGFVSPNAATNEFHNDAIPF